MSETRGTINNFEIQVVTACGMYLRPVEATNQLVSDHAGEDIAEVHSEKEGSRFIVVPKDSQVATQHVSL